LGLLLFLHEHEAWMGRSLYILKRFQLRNSDGFPQKYKPKHLTELTFIQLGFQVPSGQTMAKAIQAEEYSEQRRWDAIIVAVTEELSPG
jgi:hypothetical protein